MKIKVDKKELRSLNADFISYTEKLKTIIDDLKNESNRISRYWDEPSSKTFFKIINDDYIVKLNIYVKSLESCSDYLTNALYLYDKLETTFSNKKIDV